MLKTYLTILEELGWPNVFLVHPEQFEHTEGDRLGGDYGISAVSFPIITIHRGLRGRVLKNAIYHELGHQLWPWRQHWWIWFYGYVMADGGGNWEKIPSYGHTIDELPKRPRLLVISQRAVVRFNEKRMQ